MYLKQKRANVAVKKLKGVDIMQDMTCPQCKENVPLDKFNGTVCVKCSEKPKKPSKNKGV